MLWLLLLDVIGLICIYFLLRQKLRRDIGVENQIDRIRTHFNDLTVDMNGATSRNIELLENRIKEAKKLIRRLDAAIDEARKTDTEAPKVPNSAEPIREIREEEVEEDAAVRPPISEVERETILKWAQKGMSSEEIAELSGRQLQEVELIVSFSKAAENSKT